MTFRKSLALPRRLRFGARTSLRIRLSRKAVAANTGARGQKHYGFTLYRPKTNTLLIRWDGIGDFAIQHGRKILAQVRYRTSRGEFRDVLLSNIAALALLEQGVETFHASGVELAGRAVAFAGRASSAKSTLAALFVQRGGRILTDDLLPLHRSGKQILAYPSQGEIKLMPAAARALRLVWRQLSPLSRRLPKRIWRAQPPSAPRPLAAVYFLSLAGRRGARIVLRPLSRREAFRALLANNFNATLMTRRRLRRLFTLCTEIARRVPARRLIVPRGLHRLAEVAERIEQDLAGIRP